MYMSVPTSDEPPPVPAPWVYKRNTQWKVLISGGVSAVSGVATLLIGEPFRESMNATVKNVFTGSAGGAAVLGIITIVAHFIVKEMRGEAEVRQKRYARTMQVHLSENDTI